MWDMLDDIQRSRGDNRSWVKNLNKKFFEIFYDDRKWPGSNRLTKPLLKSSDMCNYNQSDDNYNKLITTHLITIT